jgi:hypothetical protein
MTKLKANVQSNMNGVYTSVSSFNSNEVKFVVIER